MKKLMGAIVILLVAAFLITFSLFFIDVSKAKKESVRLDNLEQAQFKRQIFILDSTHKCKMEQIEELKLINDSVLSLKIEKFEKTMKENDSLINAILEKLEKRNKK